MILSSPSLTIPIGLQKCPLILNVLLWSLTLGQGGTAKGTHTIQARQSLRSSQKKKEKESKLGFMTTGIRHCAVCPINLPMYTQQHLKNHHLSIISSFQDKVWITRRLTNLHEVIQFLNVGLGFDLQSTIHDIMIPKTEPELFSDASLC